MVAVALFIANSLASPYFLSPWSLSDATFNFTEKAIIALASTAMGFALQFGVGTPGLVAIALARGQPVWRRVPGMRRPHRTASHQKVLCPL